MKLGWLSDIHLDFLGGDPSAARPFITGLREHAADAWLVTGDIATAWSVTEQVAIVGDDGWADARIGNALTTPVLLNDFRLIADLRGLDRPDLVRKLNRLGDAAAARLAPKLAQAAATCERVIVLTHVPPYREAAWHEGRHSDDDWAPWFTCRAVGEAIDACAREHPATSFLVLCGHTHGEGTYAPRDNVVVHTAKAVYGAPRVQRVFEV